MDVEIWSGAVFVYSCFGKWTLDVQKYSNDNNAALTVYNIFNDLGLEFLAC